MRANKKIGGFPGPATPREAFSDRNTHPLVLGLLMVKECGPEYLSWEPETCWSEIRQIWGVAPSDSAKNKIQALRTCHVSDQPYERWDVFDNVAVALFGMPPRFESIQRPTPHRAAGALSIMRHVRENQTVSREVYKYVAATMLDHGHALGLGPLEPCNRFLAEQLGERVVAKVRSAVDSAGSVFSGRPASQDVQVMKALSVRDFVESLSRMLLGQLEAVLP
jgi:hypothetical protein